jgi:glycosyltransferase involved in cell wall biosynthesis
MRIVHIEDWFHPGMGYQINFFARYHNPSDEFFIITAEDLTLWGNPLTKEELLCKDKEFETKYNVKIIRLPIKLARPRKHNVWLKGLIGKIEQLNPDILYVHAMESLTSLRVFLKKRILKKYKVVTDTHTLYNQHDNSFKNKLMISMLKTLIIRPINKFNIKVFFTANENRDILTDFYGVKPELVKSCYIGTDISIYFYSEEKGLELRKNLDIEKDTTVLLYAGKFNFTKKPHLILEAVNKLNGKLNKKLSVVFVGSQNKEYFGKYFSDIPSGSFLDVKILPAIENTELYKYYSMANFAVFPKENTLSALDAQVCKLPIIMEEDSTNRERLQKGGMLYKKDNIDDLAAKILYFVEHSEEIKEMGERGSEFVSATYDYRKIIEKLEKDLK